MLFVGGCSKNDGDSKKEKLKPLEEVSDVTTKMSDARFADFCLEHFDGDGDGTLSMGEAANTAILELPDGSQDKGTSLNLISLSGIEYFTNLELLDCSNNLLTELDLSYNQKLEWLDCSNNKISELNLSRLEVLESLYCEENQLTVLTISSSAKRLERIWCDNNKLPVLDIRGLANLDNLDCSDNQLSSLDLTGCVRLTEVDCSFNQLNSLNIPDGQLLEELECHMNQLTSLDLSHCPKLKGLSSSSNSLTSLDLSHCPDLENFGCDDNKLEILDVTNNPLLTHLRCQDNPNLHELWLSQEIANLYKDDHTVIYWNGKFITVDGNFDDWKPYSPYLTMLPASRPSNGDYTDLEAMFVTTNANYLYFYITYKRQYQDNAFEIYLDADLNASTGYNYSYWLNCGADYKISGIIPDSNNSNPASFDAYIYDERKNQVIAEQGSGAVVGSHPVENADGTYGIEFAVKRSAIPELGNKIRIGAFLDHSGYNGYRGILPQGENSSYNSYAKTNMLTVDLP